MEHKGNENTKPQSIKRPKLETSWLNRLQSEFEQPYFEELKHFLVEERANQVVYPPGGRIFAAFDHTPFDRVKVVILGQDPYHGTGQANGLCFSVADGTKHPPSLRNIFKEIESDIGHAYPTSGNLEPWADQGVLLLNATLTVRAHQAGSHQGKGWEIFTDRVIELLSNERKDLVFLLWGKFAQNKAANIDSGKHHILTAPHPSPFSAHTGFFGCRHFSQTNALLQQNGQNPIDWRLS
ncbi:MAG: uracil-DNA glycosylase [Flavobacteriales bacterium]|nr:uracil-DNA glycosylase [Flavobacteriales bacterium]